jgi:glycosyltransferase involved in cell wall biosynthesis
MAGEPRVAMTLTQDWHAVPGGTAVAANALAEAIHTGGLADVVGVVPAGGRPAAGFAPPVPTAALSLPVPWLYDAWHHLRRPRVTSASGVVDLVHLTIPIAAPAERVPTVATVHDLLPLTMPERFRRRGVRLMTRGLDRIRQEAAAVMVPSEWSRREFERHGFDPARLHVVPLGVEPLEPARPEEVERVLARHHLRHPFVLFVGTAEPRKGLDVLVSAWARLRHPDAELVLVGPAGWGGLEEPLETLGPGVHRLGFLPRDELRILQGAAAVSCLPSRAEGFGLPVLEAMAAGSPVVTTSASAMEEVADGAAVLVPVGDVEALAAAIEGILGDPGGAQRLRELGRARAAGYGWERSAAAVGAVYREVLG